MVFFLSFRYFSSLFQLFKIELVSLGMERGPDKEFLQAFLSPICLTLIRAS
jgi:hypothetical protein